MRASHLMALAVVLYIAARWAHGEPAVTAGSVVGGIFAILVIAALDQGRTEEIARGFAWLFVVAAGYQAIGPIAAAAQAKSKTRKAGAGPAPAQ